MRTSVFIVLLAVHLASASLSVDGTCSGANNYTCKDSKFGDCCSSSNYCGSSGAYCGQGWYVFHSSSRYCARLTFLPTSQQLFSGACQTGKISSNDATCGPTNGQTCAGGLYDGQCCSTSGYCGRGLFYCSPSDW